MTAAKLEPCPNPECPGSEPMIDQHPQILTSKAVRVICLGCQTSGPLRNTETEARRLWNALPRTPHEPPDGSVKTLPLDEAIAEYMRAFGLAVRRVEIIGDPRRGEYAEVYIDPRGVVLIPFRFPRREEQPR